MIGNVENYPGLTGLAEAVIGGQKYVKVFIDATATQQTDGNVVIVSYVKSASSTDTPNVRTPATTSVAVRVGIMTTWQLNNATVVGSGGAAGTVTPGVTPVGQYGWVQIKGYCPKVAVPASVAAERYLSATNGTLVATDVAAANQDGVTGITAKCFAITKTADTGATGFTDAVILDREVTI